MTPKSFKISLILIGVAVTALIFSQLYWIDNAIRLKQNEFNRLVSETLNEVTIAIEKEETLNQLQSHQQGKFLFFNTDSISSNIMIPDTGYDVMLMREINKENDVVEINIIEERNGSRLENTIIKTSQNSGLDTLTELLEDKFKIRLNELDDISTNIEEVSSQVDSILKKRVKHKTAVIGDIVKSLIQVDIYASIDERLSKSNLMGKLTNSLKEKGITADLYFGVFDDKENLVLTNAVNQSDFDLMLKSEFKAQLFPNDIIGRANSLKIYFPNKTSILLNQMWGVLLLSVLILIIIIIGFAYTFRIIFRQKKISEMKNDFINNITHELKTPISTISLACQSLSDSTIAQDKTVMDRYVSMIGEENKRLGTLVENVLQSAIFDKGDFKLKKENISIKEVAKKAINNVKLQVAKNDGEIHLEGDDCIVFIDEMHFVNILTNLLDNANKYNTNNPKIEVNIIEKSTVVELSIADNGIGISKEHQKRIFERLYRVPTGNVHNTKGYGLGLSYVKTILDRHEASISVNSQIEKGSKFTIIIPK